MNNKIIVKNVLRLIVLMDNIKILKLSVVYIE